MDDEKFRVKLELTVDETAVLLYSLNRSAQRNEQQAWEHSAAGYRALGDDLRERAAIEREMAARISSQLGVPA